MHKGTRNSKQGRRQPVSNGLGESGAVEPSQSRTIGDRIWAFLHNSLFLTAVAIVTALIALFAIPLLLIISGLCVMVAFYREGVVRGRVWWQQGIAYAGVFGMTCGLLYSAHIAIERHLPELPQAIADAVVARLSKLQERAATHDSVTAVVGHSESSKRLPTPTAGPPYISPRGPGIKMEGGVVTPSSEMCVGMSDKTREQCLCPRPLKYSIKSLPAPADNNYAFELSVKSVREPVYHLRVFSRTKLDYATLAFTSPYGADKSASALGTYQYDPYTVTMQSSAPQKEYKAIFHTAEGLRLVCVNQDN